MINTKYLRILLTCFIPTVCLADLASPTPFKATQPNGIEIEIYNRGNYLQGWHEYHEWTIVQNIEGWWVFAAGNVGFQLIPSNLKVGIDPEPNPLSSSIQKIDGNILNNHQILFFPEPGSLSHSQADPFLD